MTVTEAQFAVREPTAKFTMNDFGLSLAKPSQHPVYAES